MIKYHLVIINQRRILLNSDQRNQDVDLYRENGGYVKSLSLS